MVEVVDPPESVWVFACLGCLWVRSVSPLGGEAQQGQRGHSPTLLLCARLAVNPQLLQQGWAALGTRCLQHSEMSRHV